MKRKQRGFTIVELLAVIVLLAIITTIAMSGYNAIQKNLKEKAYENLISYIESKAANYATDTGNLLTNVDTLVKEGYIDADDEEGNVYNPITKENLNCHIVNIERDNDNLYGRYSNEEECETTNLTIKNLNLNIEMYETSDNVTKGNKIENNSWTNKNVILKAVLNEDLKNEPIKNITWQSNIARETTNKDEYLVSAEQIINTNYTVIVETEGGVSYQASVVVKIDKQRPVIYEAQIERENDWVKEDKKLNISASDGNGSGISGYYVGNEQDCTKATFIEQESNNYETALDNGTYYICVKDKAGNYTEDVSHYELKIEKVDKTAPECIWTGESTVWTKSDRTITLGCKDEESGCVLQNEITKIYNSNTKTDNWNYEIEDKAGNKTTCNKDVDVYVDKCTSTRASYGSWGSCSRSCGGGHKSRTITYYSTFGSGFTCGSRSESTSCHTSPCESDSGSSSGGSSGGGGGRSCKKDGSSSCWGCCDDPETRATGGKYGPCCDWCNCPYP